MGHNVAQTATKIYSLRFMRYIIAAICFAIALTPSISNADLVVGPSQAASAEGDAQMTFPFSSVANATQRYQQVYDFSLFSFSGQITQIAFRVDGGGGSHSGTIADMQINLSTTSTSVDSLSSTFASNVGGDDTEVFRGQVDISTSASGTNRPFEVIIDLDTAFDYDPTQGNLLMDIRRHTQGLSFLPLDAANVADETSSVATHGTLENVNTATTTNGSGPNTRGLVTRFDITANIPEPGSFIVLAALGIAGLRRRIR